MFKVDTKEKLRAYTGIILSLIKAGREDLKVDYGNNGFGFNSTLHLSQACFNYLFEEEDTRKIGGLLQDAFIAAALPPLREIKQVAAGLIPLLPEADISKATSLKVQAETYIDNLEKDDISFSGHVDPIAVFIEKAPLTLNTLQQTASENRERSKNFWKKPAWYIPVLLAGFVALWTIIVK